jgi:hypothetical protein
MAAEPFVRLLKSFDEQKLDIRAFLLLKDCVVVLERYKEGLTRDHNHALLRDKVHRKHAGWRSAQRRAPCWN